MKSKWSTIRRDSEISERTIGWKEYITKLEKVLREGISLGIPRNEFVRTLRRVESQIIEEFVNNQENIEEKNDHFDIDGCGIGINSENFE